jgi:hypothetical protein
MRAAGGAGGLPFTDVDLAGRIPARHPLNRNRPAVEGVRPDRPLRCVLQSAFVM